MLEKVFRFPGFKYKAVTLSYDDGTIYDKKLIEIMSKYGIRGTFNLSTTFSATVGGCRRIYRRKRLRLCIIRRATKWQSTGTTIGA